MSRHSRILDQLYDYATDNLLPENKGEVEEHISACAKCQEQLNEIQSVLRLIGTSSQKPSEALDDAYWQMFASRIEDKVRDAHTKKALPLVSFFTRLQSFLVIRPRYVALASGALVLIIIGFLLGRNSTSITTNNEIAQQSQSSIQDTIKVIPASVRFDQYLRKSKVLLVGIANMKVDNERTLDLSAEQRLSRELIREARYLSRQEIDFRSQLLIGEMNKILIELANLEESSDVPDVEMIRGGIHQENLLFKIRMAEAARDTSNRL